jgi:hypothetical protein
VNTKWEKKRIERMRGEARKWVPLCANCNALVEVGAEGIPDG